MRNKQSSSTELGLSGDNINKSASPQIGTASAYSVEFRGIRARMYIEDLPVRVAQLVTCLVTDESLTTDPGSLVDPGPVPYFLGD